MKNHLPISFLPSAVLWLMFNLAATNIGFAQLVKIDAISQKGILSWTAPLNSDCSVEWANIQSPTQWFGDWISMLNIQMTNQSAQLAVPSLYRITCWTNGLFIRPKVGQTFIFTASNALAQIWEERYSVVGMATLPVMTNNYWILALTHSYSGNPPSGITDDQMLLTRSTDKAVFVLQGIGQEIMAWQNQAIGTTWTYGDTTATIESIEDVSVPAGNYTGCLKIKKTDQSNPALPWYEWIKPGFFQVKWLDYQIDDPRARPVVYWLKQVVGP